MGLLAMQLGYTHDQHAYVDLGALLSAGFIDSVAIAATPDSLAAQLDAVIVNPILGDEPSPSGMTVLIETFAQACLNGSG
jgi:hypothetical protein